MEDKYVALKICSAAAKQSESIFLKQLTNQHGPAADTHTQILLSTFECKSINGRHQVLVLEPLGNTLGQYLETGTLTADSDHLPRTQLVRCIARQMILGLSHVHSCGIVHRDLHPSNILFALQPNLDLVAEGAFQQSLAAQSDLYRVQRLDGQPLEDGIPPYVVEPRPLDDGLPLKSSPEQIRVVIVDFDAASTFEDANDGRHAFPVATRPPELVLGMPMLAPQADIWSLGCLIFETVTTRSLFHIDMIGTSVEEEDNDYLQNITEVLGPLPQPFLDRWKARSHIVDDNGVILTEVAAEGISEPLQELVEKYKPEDMSDSEAALFLDFLGRMLRFEPSARATTEELLQHPWLQDHP